MINLSNDFKLRHTFSVDTKALHFIVKERITLGYERIGRFKGIEIIKLVLGALYAFKASETHLIEFFTKKS